MKISSNVNGVIRAVLSLFIFFYEKILDAQKAQKAQKRNQAKAQKAQKRIQAKAQKAQKSKEANK